MSKNNVRGQEQKSFVRLFDGISNRIGRWEKWNDLIMLLAIEISNAVDLYHVPARRESYQAILKKYKPEEQERIPAVIADLVNNLEQNPFQDFLGTMYMELELGSDHAGQFFTPYNICYMMAKTTMANAAEAIERRGYVTVNEPSCGAGANLIAAAEALHDIGYNYQTCMMISAQDLDQTVAMMCYVQLSLIGCAGYVHVGNTLTEPLTGKDALIPSATDSTWFTPMYFTSLWSGRVFAKHLDLMMREMRRMDAQRKKEVVQVERAEQQPEQISFF